MDQYSREFIAEKARLHPEDSRARTHGTTISQPTWLGVPDRLHPAHGAGAGPATFRDPRGPRGLCGNGAECESPRSRSLCAARAPQGRTATRPRPVRPLRPTGSARLRTPNRRGELPASHPRSYHLYIRTRSLVDPGVIEDVLAVENDVVPFDRADVLGAGLRPGLPR